MAPTMPHIASVYSLALYFPTAKLLIQPSEQYAILMSPSHSLTIDTIAAFKPMHTKSGSVRNEKVKLNVYSPTRRRTNQLSPSRINFLDCNQTLLNEATLPEYIEAKAVWRATRSLLFLSNDESCIQFCRTMTEIKNLRCTYSGDIFVAAESGLSTMIGVMGYN
jgi:hypothetical protein